MTCWFGWQVQWWYDPLGSKNFDGLVQQVCRWRVPCPGQLEVTWPPEPYGSGGIWCILAVKRPVNVLWVTVVTKQNNSKNKGESIDVLFLWFWECLHAQNFQLVSSPSLPSTTLERSVVSPLGTFTLLRPFTCLTQGPCSLGPGSYLHLLFTWSPLFSSTAPLLLGLVGPLSPLFHPGVSW